MDFNTVLTMTDSEKIKLYISRFTDAPEREKRTVKRSTKKAASSKYYEVTLSSGLDVVIDRKTEKEISQFIFMPSQDKYLFKSGEVIENIVGMELNKFLKFFDDSKIIKVNGLLIYELTSYDLEYLHSMIQNEDCREDLKNGVLSLGMYEKLFCSSRYSYTTGKSIYDYAERSYSLIKDKKEKDKIKKLLAVKTPILTNQTKYDGVFIDAVIEIYLAKGYDIARNFVEAYTKSSMKGIDTGYSYCYRSRSKYGFAKLFEYGLEPKNLIDYLCFQLYAQGYRTIPVNTYCDYLDMAKECDEKIKDKYPDALLTAHDIATLKYNQHKEEIDQRKFASRYVDFEKMLKIPEHERVIFKSSDCSVVIPEKSQELINEGINLGHCVGGYVHRVADGECVIVFVRHDSSIDSSYLTVELRPINEYGKENYSIAQIQGDNKRTTLTEDEKKFFEKFMKKTGFKTSNRNFA